MVATGFGTGSAGVIDFFNMNILQTRFEAMKAGKLHKAGESPSLTTSN
jgi:hypothetical protein